jgi:hypothetical protein
LGLCTNIYINKCKIKSRRDGSKNRADWEKFVKEAKLSIGMYCLLTKIIIRRRRRRRRRKSKALT